VLYTNYRYVSFALLLVFSQLALQLPVFTLLSQIALTIAYPSSLVLPSVRLACLDRIQLSAARLIDQIAKFGNVTGYMLKVLRWLPVRERIEYRVASLVWQCQCQLGIAPIYLIGMCRSVPGITSGRSLRSAGRGVLSVPFARTSLMLVRAFCVNCPSVWNGLPLELRLLSRTLSDTFYCRLKTVLTVLELGAPLSSSGLEKALYKFFNE